MPIWRATNAQAPEAGGQLCRFDYNRCCLKGAHGKGAYGTIDSPLTVVPQSTARSLEAARRMPGVLKLVRRHSPNALSLKRVQPIISHAVLHQRDDQRHSIHARKHDQTQLDIKHRVIPRRSLSILSTMTPSKASKMAFLRPKSRHFCNGLAVFMPKCHRSVALLQRNAGFYQANCRILFPHTAK